MRFEGSYIQSLQKKGQLPWLEFHHLRFRFWPLEPVLLKPFLKETKSIEPPVENLENGSTPIAEDKQMPREGIEIHRSFHQHGKTIDCFPHIRASQGQKHPGVGG